jgi:hypothetical protein
MTLWHAEHDAEWRAALACYVHVVERQGVTRLPELDRWYRDELPATMHARTPMHVAHDELVRLTEWKMARGVWRAPNLVLVRSNAPDVVVDTSRTACEAACTPSPHPTAPIKLLSTLKGVGPATASAVTAAAAPGMYPFFDELVAAQVPSLGTVAWTLGYYARYAAALRERAALLGNDWTPVMVERALWSYVGGKAGVS